MIILVTDNPVQVETLCTHLKQKGYLYLVVPDDKKALDAIRTDRASLLLVDTDCPSFDGFELCRAVKTDPALHDLPVVLLTSLSDVGVLLAVLDCTADAFIAKPPDPRTLFSTIDDLQKVPEGGRMPVAVRTRFRVTQEGRDYSVVADRRQLLEFLLSTFELAVRIHREQDQMRSDLQSGIKDLNDRLSTLAAERDATVRNLHDELEERSRTINRLNAVIRERDQQEAPLRIQAANLSEELKKKGAALEISLRLTEEKSQRIAALEGQLAAVIKEKENTEQERRQQLHELNARIERLERDLTAANTELADERGKRSGLEGQLQTLRQDNEARERELQDMVRKLIRQHDEQKSALEAAQNLFRNEQRMHASVETDLTALREKYANAQQFLDSASRDIGVLNAALAEEKERTKRAEEHLKAARQESEDRIRTIKALRDELAALKNRSRQKSTPPAENEESSSPTADTGDSQQRERDPLPASAQMPVDWTVNRDRLFDMIKWVHHSDAVLPEQRKELLASLVRLSRLVQKGRHLTNRQEETLRTLFAQLQELGYRFH